VTEYLRSLFQTEDFKRRFIFTLFMFAIYRLGSHIPMPGIDTAALEDFFRRFEGTLFSLYDIFSGGNSYYACCGNNVPCMDRREDIGKRNR